MLVAAEICRRVVVVSRTSDPTLSPDCRRPPIPQSARLDDFRFGLRVIRDCVPTGASNNRFTWAMNSVVDAQPAVGSTGILKFPAPARSLRRGVDCDCSWPRRPRDARNRRPVSIRGEIALGPRLRVGRNYRQEQGALANLFSNLASHAPPPRSSTDRTIPRRLGSAGRRQ